MAGRWDWKIGTVVPASGAARSTVIYWRLQVFFLIHSGRTGAGSCRGTGSVSCEDSLFGSSYGSSSSSACGYVAPSTASLADTVCLEGDDKLRVHRRDLRHESQYSIIELCNGGAVTCRGHR